MSHTTSISKAASASARRDRAFATQAFSGEPALLLNEMRDVVAGAKPIGECLLLSERLKQLLGEDHREAYARQGVSLVLNNLNEFFGKLNSLHQGSRRLVSPQIGHTQDLGHEDLSILANSIEPLERYLGHWLLTECGAAPKLRSTVEPAIVLVVHQIPQLQDDTAIFCMKQLKDVPIIVASSCAFPLTHEKLADACLQGAGGIVYHAVGQDNGRLSYRTDFGAKQVYLLGGYPDRCMYTAVHRMVDQNLHAGDNSLHITLVPQLTYVRSENGSTLETPQTTEATFELAKNYAEFLARPPWGRNEIRSTRAGNAAVVPLAGDFSLTVSIAV